MKEDLEIAKTNILGLIEENTKLKQESSDYFSADRNSEVIYIKLKIWCMKLIIRFPLLSILFVKQSINGRGSLIRIWLLG